MLLSDLLRHINHLGEPTYQFWARDIKPYYEPLVNQIFTDPEDQKLLKKSRRIFVLFRYWGMNKVSNLEEAKASIPLCRYCHERLALPRSTEPKNEGDEWITVCRCPQCAKKYTYDQTKRSLKKFYGVENISSSPEVRLKKSLIQRQNHLNHGQEIIEKRRKTCLERYGVTNVSKIETVQTKKEETCQSNFGSCNPQFNSDINIERTRNNLCRHSKGYPVKICDKTFFFLDPDEENFVRYLIQYVHPDVINTNNIVHEMFIDGRSHCYAVDVTIGNTFFIECKSSSLFSRDMTNTEYLREKMTVMKNCMKDNQRYIILCRPRSDKHISLILDNTGGYGLNSDTDNIRDIRTYFEDEIALGQNPSFHMKRQPNIGDTERRRRNFEERLVFSLARISGYDTNLFKINDICQRILPLYTPEQQQLILNDMKIKGSLAI